MRVFISIYSSVDPSLQAEATRPSSVNFSNEEVQRSASSSFLLQLSEASAWTSERKDFKVRTVKDENSQEEKLSLLWLLETSLRADVKLLNRDSGEKQDASLSALVPWQSNSIQSWGSPIQSSKRWKLPYSGQWVYTGSVCPVCFVSTQYLFSAFAYVAGSLSLHIELIMILCVLFLIQETFIAWNMNWSELINKKWHDITVILYALSIRYKLVVAVIHVIIWISVTWLMPSCITLYFFFFLFFCTHALQCKTSSPLFAYFVAPQGATPFASANHIIFHGTTFNQNATEICLIVLSTQ